MSEEPLSPKTTYDLYGHSEAEQTFLESYNAGRLHHAWLITGPRGIGKATLAYRMARFLFKHGRLDADESGGGLFGDAAPPVKPETLDVLADDPVSRRIEAGGHGDLLIIEREFDEKKNRFKGQIGVDRVRGVGNFMSKTASEGGWRVVIVDAADEMNRNAANALLKILEEPPEQAILFLVTHNPGRLLPTIRSRCRTLPLKPLAHEEIIALMAHHAPDSSPEEAFSLAKLSEGSFGRALSLHEEGGVGLYKDVVSIVSGGKGMDGQALHALADKVSKSGADEAFRTLGQLFTWLLGRLISQGARGQTDQIGLSEEDDAVLLRLLAQAPLDELINVWEKATDLFQRGQQGDLDKKHVVLTAFLSLQACLKG